MPPTAIKHQLTCPFEFSSGSFLIGRRRILVIPRNHLVGSRNLTITVSTIMLYQEVTEISLRSGKSQGRWKSKNNGHPVMLSAGVVTCLTIPGESPNTILTNMCVVGSNGGRTSSLTFHVPRRFMERFSGGFFISVSFPTTDLECLIRNLIFNSLKFK